MLWTPGFWRRALKFIIKLHLSFQTFHVYQVFRQAWQILLMDILTVCAILAERRKPAEGSTEDAHLVSALRKRMWQRYGQFERNFLLAFCLSMKTLQRGEGKFTDTSTIPCIIVCNDTIIIDESQEREVSRVSVGIGWHASPDKPWRTFCEPQKRKCVFPPLTAAAGNSKHWVKWGIHVKKETPNAYS